MKPIFLILIAMLLSGCGRSWVQRKEPTTAEERSAVSEQVAKIMAATPKALAGHDQDWDDAIEAAHRVACIELCRPTFWEWDIAKQQFTGKWRYAEEVKP